MIAGFKALNRPLQRPKQRALEVHYPEVDDQRRTELPAIRDRLIIEHPARH